MDASVQHTANNASTMSKRFSRRRHRGTRIRNYLREYCQNSGIHGLIYLAEKRSLCERFSWAIIIITSIVACGYMINNMYKKYDQSPVIVSFATKESPIFTIPFPAVTICPVTKSNRRKLNYTNLIYQAREQNLTSEEETQGQYMSMVCSNFLEEMLFPLNKTFTDDFFKVLHKVRLPIPIVGSSFMDDALPLKAFKPIITDQGICYTFNMLNRQEIFKNNVVHYSNYHQGNKTNQWSIDYGYSSRNLTVFPRRALLSGAENSLKIFLFFSTKHIDYLCAEQVQGFSITLHTPNSVPKPKNHYFQVPCDTAVMAAIQPKMMTTSKDVKRYKAVDRKCYLSDEKPLKYFKIYTLGNCRMECLTNYTLEQCNCVAFFMPRENITSICGNANLHCMKMAERKLKKEEVQNLINKETNGRTNKVCDCMPLCSELTYDIELSQTEWEWDKQWSDYDQLSEKMKLSKNFKYSTLSIFFKTEHFWTTQRNELYGFTDFLANFGGLLGLFTGFSLLSLVEIVYFLTLRIFCNIRHYRVSTGSTEDVEKRK